METITQYVCGVIPPHILQRIAERTSGRAAACHAGSTISHMREVAARRIRRPLGEAVTIAPGAVPARKRRRVYDARQKFRLPGTLVRSEGSRRARDVEVNEAYDGSGFTYDFFARVFHRNSIDDAGMRLDSTVHYGRDFNNAMWNGKQIVYGEGDGRVFDRFTASLDVIGHELTHGVTQFAASLDYEGETGALNEHLSDAFGIMVKQYTYDQTADESDWLIGSEILGPDVNGIAIRSMALPGSAYDDTLLGRDPQPWHMHDYVETDEDHGGVHINSGIPNHAFYLAATNLGGKTWEVLGRVWYAVLTERLGAHDTFRDFARATVEAAGDLYGRGNLVAQTIAQAWRDVGVEAPRVGARVPVRRRGGAGDSAAIALLAPPPATVLPASGGRGEEQQLIQ